MITYEIIVSYEAENIPGESYEILCESITLFV